ncbi:MAG: glycosyltransferase family 2 protein [Patescibacteria group bacterium]|nr:glycosyltransferase family 2 protein [Patescibacteria group bacterium]
MKLSICLAVYNEVENLHYAMDSVRDFGDEVVVVDGGSDDGTIAALERYGKRVRILHADNPPMFHKNKQKALDAAKGEWILQLDADEAVSEGLKEEIRQVIGSPDSLDAYRIPRLNYFLGRFLRKGGQYPDYTIRLYKRGSAYFPCESVHEQVAVAGGEERIGTLKHDLLHYADPGFERYLMRWNRYTSMDAMVLRKELQARGKKLGIPDFLNYFLVQPVRWFLLTYIRHKGFMDGFPGFVFSLFSAIRFWVIYVKTWHNHGKKSP